MKSFHTRPRHLRFAFEDKFAHLVWAVDVCLADDSVAAAPLYTLNNRWTAKDAGNASTAWAWKHQGLYQVGALSPWLTNNGTRDRFSTLQLDVFFAL